MITLQQDTIYMGTAAPASGGGGSGDAVWGSITGTLANQTDLATALAGKQDVIDANNKLSANYVSGLATVATTGAYGDLSGTPDLSNYVTTNTEQNITGIKTFVGDKRINFKQSSSSNKLGFTLYNNSNAVVGFFEYNPNPTALVNNKQIMTLGDSSITSEHTTYVGFRYSGSAGAYNLLAPLGSDVKTLFHLTSTATNFYLPLGVTDGTTMVTTNSTGVLDISPLIPTYSAFGGATGSVAGSAGLVPAPTATDNDKYLKGDGTWATVSGGGGSSSYDDETINENASNELQAIGLKEARTDTAIRLWHGTEEQWNTGGGIKDTYYSWAKPVGEDGTLPVTAQWFIAYGNDTYVAVNNSNNATSAYSSNGKHWTTVTHTSSYQANNIGYGDGVFITGRMTTNTFGYSDDNGQTWKESNATQDTIPTQMYSFVYGDGTFVVTGYSRLSFYSTDKGKNWSSSNLPSEGTWYTAYGNGRFVSVKNYSNEAAYSTDNGQTWTSMTLPVNDGWTSIAYGNGRFVVTNGTSNKVLVLLDNSTIWNNYSITGNAIDSLYGICFDGKQFIGLNNKKVATTIDGEHWNTEYAAITTSSQIISIRTLAYGKDKVIVNTNNEINCMFTFDYVYTTDENPTSSSTLYSEPDVTSLLTITGYYSGYPYYNGYIILSNNDIYTRNEVVNSYYTIAETHPNYLCFINNVGIKMGNVSFTPVVDQTYSASSTNAQSGVAVASGIADTLGTIETALQGV